MKKDDDEMNFIESVCDKTNSCFWFYWLSCTVGTIKKIHFINGCLLDLLLRVWGR